MSDASGNKPAGDVTGSHGGPPRNIGGMTPEPLGRPGLRHWQQSVITHPGLEDRGSVFFAAIEMTRMPMILTDPTQPDNPISFANNAFLDLTGYEESEVIGRNCRFLQGSNTDREAVAIMRDAIENEQAVTVELCNYRRDGTMFWNAVFIGPVYDQDGTLIYFFASQLDVSRRRESEEALRQSQKMEAIGQLTAGLAHDFNNLLHIISASLERMTARRHDDKAFARFTEAATTAADRAAKLTTQLLAFARRSRLEPRPIDITELVTANAELLDATVGSRAELHLNLRRRLPAVLVDPAHLGMALLNIVINARDASAAGGTITIATSRARDPAPDGPPRDGVVLSVTDEGSGMAADVVARATEPFFTTKAAGEAAGLGLAMTQGFVEQSGGSLEIQSEAGSGTTIRLFFPAADASKRAEDVASRFEPISVDSSRPPLVLVVDDSPDIAAIAEEALRDVGYRVVVAHSGEDGLKRLAEAPPASPVSLVFTDVIMPGGMTGLAFAEIIRARYPTVPILFTTGYNDKMALEGPQVDAMDVIGKPYRRNELIDRVQVALSRGAPSGSRRMPSDFGHARE